MARVKKTLRNFIIWKVALYIRLSKEDGNEVSYSVLNQEKILRRFIEESDIDFELFDIYIDDGKTGTDSKRENFQRMLGDINDKKVDCVIVKDLSRLSRNYAESGLYLEQFFVEKDIRFISLELPALDSYLKPDEVSSIATAFQNIVNDDFCRQTSIKIRGTFNRKRTDGEFIGAFAPYGYLKDPLDRHRLVIDDKSAEVVKDIFDWFINGQSKTGIAIKLNDLGIMSPAIYKQSIGLNYQNPNVKNTNALWSMATINCILKNEVYLGHMVQGKQKVKSYKVHKQVSVPKEEWFIKTHTHEPIISQTTFDKADNLLKRDIKTANNQRKTYLFSGFLKCADCQKGMHRQTTGKYVYYSCKTYKTQSKLVCTKHSIREDELTQAVTDAINMQISLIENKKQLIEEIQNAPVTKNRVIKIEDSLNQKELEIDKINRIRDGLYMDWKTGDITRDDYARLRETQDTQLSTLRESLKSLKSELETIQNELNTDSPIFQMFKKEKRIDTIDRGLLIEFIEQIYIKENKKIEIKFKFADQMKHLISLLDENNNSLGNEAKSKKLSFK